MTLLSCFSQIPGPSSNIPTWRLQPSPAWPPVIMLTPSHFYSELCCQHHLTPCPHNTSLHFPGTDFHTAQPYSIHTPCLDLQSLPWTFSIVSLLWFPAWNLWSFTLQILLLLLPVQGPELFDCICFPFYPCLLPATLPQLVSFVDS